MIATGNESMRGELSIHTIYRVCVFLTAHISSSNNYTVRRQGSLLSLIPVELRLFKCLTAADRQFSDAEMKMML